SKGFDCRAATKAHRASPETQAKRRLNMPRQAALGQRDVPYLSRQQIEDEAVLLLAEYGNSHGQVTAPPVPVDEIVELYLKLTLEFKDMHKLFGFADVHGALWVNE